MSGLERKRPEGERPEGRENKVPMTPAQEFVEEVDRVSFISMLKDPEDIRRTVLCADGTELVAARFGPHGPRAIELKRQPTGENGGTYKSREYQQFVWGSDESDLLAYDGATTVYRDKPPYV